MQQYLSWLNKAVVYQDTGASMTGDVYVKKEHGPVPKEIDTLLRELEQDGSMSISEMVGSEYYTGHRTSFDAKRMVNMSCFSKKEADVLKKVTDKFLSYNAANIENQSHAEAPWLYSDFYSDIDYNSSHDITIV